MVWALHVNEGNDKEGCIHVDHNSPFDLFNILRLRSHLLAVHNTSLTGAMVRISYFEFYVHTLRQSRRLSHMILTSDPLLSSN